MVLARHALPRSREIAVVVAATALSVALGAALVGAFTAEVPFGPRSDPAPAKPAPVEQPAVPQQSAAPAPLVAPTASTAPAPAQSSQPAGATRQPFETLPIESVMPSFRPGGNLGPPYASIPPQN